MYVKNVLAGLVLLLGYKVQRQLHLQEYFECFG